MKCLWRQQMSIIDIRVLLPIISIVTMGMLEADLLKKIFKIKEPSTSIQRMLEGLVLGSVTLIIPMLLIGRFAFFIKNTTLLSRFVYGYFAIGMLYLVYIIFHYIRHSLPKIVLEPKITPERTLETLLIMIASGMLSFYAVQGLLYPLRGWDFLHFYLPHAFRVYITGQIPDINELNFLPFFKPPANTLLYSFGFYVTQSEQIQLIPIIFLAGTVYLCYQIALQAGMSKKIASMSIIFFLSTPFTYFLVYEFQYYQEVFIMFFTTAAYFFIHSMIKEQTKRKQLYYAILGSASLAGCILSKISGYILIFVIIVSLPSDKITKGIRYLFVVALSIQLVRKAAIDEFLGTGIFVGILCLYVVYLIYKSPTLKISYFRWLLMVLSLLPALLVGGYWIIHILSIPGVKEYLTTLYLEPKHSTIALQWKGIGLPATETYLENAHTATFVSSTFSIFLATMFAGTWIVYKLAGFAQMHQKSKSLLIWLIFFYAIWQSFFATGSIRYLSPIMVPLSILLAMGFEAVVQFFNTKDNKTRDGMFVLIFSALSAFLFLYPFIPVEYIFVQFHLRYYYAHTKLLSVCGQISVFCLIFFLLLWKEEELTMSFKLLKLRKHRVKKVIVWFFITLLIIVPIGAQIGLLTKEKFNLQAFQEKYCWYTRTNYLELVNAINVLGYPDDQVILTVNTAGLEYYTSQPVMDLFMLGFIENSALSKEVFPLNIENTTQLLEFFNSYKVTMFVTLNTSNVWYEAFLQRLYSQYYLFRLLFNSVFFKYRFGNEEFILFTINSLKSYIGPTDIIISDSENEESMLAYNPNSIVLRNNTPFLSFNLDFTHVPEETIINTTITTTYTTSTNSTPTVNIANYQFIAESKEQFVKVPFLQLPNATTFIHSIILEIVYQDEFTNVHKMAYTFSPLINESVNITKVANEWTYSGAAGFVIGTQ